MKRRRKQSQKGSGTTDERGISLVEMMIVVAIISVVTAFAIMRISAAQRSMRVSNSAREFQAYLEMARVDSIRRRPMNTGEMATVTINNANSYSVRIDRNGDGVLDPALTINSSAGASFAGLPFPTIIKFNWRGRAVDAADNPINLAFNIEDATGTNVQPINITSGGNTSLGSNVNAASVQINQGTNASANINHKALIP